MMPVVGTPDTVGTVIELARCANHDLEACSECGTYAFIDTRTASSHDKKWSGMTADQILEDLRKASEQLLALQPLPYEDTAWHTKLWDRIREYGRLRDKQERRRARMRRKKRRGWA